MLKLIHVQARLSVNKSVATMRQLAATDAKDYQRAAEVIAIFEQAQEQKLHREQLDLKLAEYAGTRLDYREIDGLAKVIADSFATFAPENIGLTPKLAETVQTEAATAKTETFSEIFAIDSDTEAKKEAENTSNALLTAWRLAAWKEAAKPENYPFGNSGLTVALKPGLKSLRRAAAAHDEELLARLLPAEKRVEILQKAAEDCGYNLNVPIQQLTTRLLFADLPTRHCLVALSPELNVENLLNRYNIELLRGVLYLAPRLRILVQDKYKDLFKFIKLFGLMHEVRPLSEAEIKAKTSKTIKATTKNEPEKQEKPLSEAEIAGYEIILEGASSPFLARSDRRYGIQFAKFLPALLLCEADWQLKAELVFNPAGGPTQAKDEGPTSQSKTRLVRAAYELGPQPHLRSHFKGSGEFDSLLEENLATAFEQRFKTTKRAQPGKKGGWTIKREDRVIPVFDTVMIPDFAFEHTDGRRALLEIVGFWERGYLERKIAKLNRAGRNDIIVLVSERTRCGRENFLINGEEPPYQLLFFKGTPRLGPILEALERCAVPAALSE